MSVSPFKLFAVVAVPDNVAVIVPAVKLPEASRATIADPVFAAVALEVTVNVAAAELLNVVDPDNPVPEVLRVNVFAKLPLNVVAVIVPALKLPDASRATIVDAVFAVAEFNPSSKSASRPLPVPSLPACQIVLFLHVNEAAACPIDYTFAAVPFATEYPDVIITGSVPLPSVSPLM